MSPREAQSAGGQEGHGGLHKGGGSGFPWWPSGKDSGLSLPWPGFNPWLGN